MDFCQTCLIGLCNRQYCARKIVNGVTGNSQSSAGWFDAGERQHGLLNALTQAPAFERGQFAAGELAQDEFVHLLIPQLGRDAVVPAFLT